MHTIADKKLLMLKPSDIISTGSTPRQFFNVDELTLLSRSISATGIIHPLAVRKAPHGKYRLITGERRLRAAKMAGIRRIPCILHNVDDESAEIYALAENIQHSDLTVFEEARFLYSLIFERGVSESELSLRLGITQSAISAKLKLLRLDSLTQEKVIKYNLSETHARLLLRLPENLRGSLADTIYSEGLSEAKTETLIREILNFKRPKPEVAEEKKKAPEPPPVAPKTAIGDIRLFENSLVKLTQTLASSGINSDFKTTETSKYLEYRIKIEKASFDNEKYKQLKIC